MSNGGITTEKDLLYVLLIKKYYYCGLLLIREAKRKYIQ